MAIKAVEERGYFCENKLNFSKAFFVAIAINIVFAAYNILQAQPLLFLGLLIMVVVLFICNDHELLLVVAMLIPNIMMIKALDSFAAILSYYVLLINLKYLMRYGKSGISVLIVGHLAAVVVTSVIYKNFGVLFSAIKTVLFLIYIFDITKTSAFKSIEYKEKIVLFYIIGILLNIFFGVLYFSSAGESIYTNLFGGIRNDRNYFSSMLSFGIALSLVMLRIEKKKSVPYVISLFIFLFFGFVSQSRTFFLSLIFSVIILCSFIQNKRTTRVLVVVAIVGAAACYVLKDTIYDIVSSLLLRFTEDDVSTGSYRTKSWSYFLNLTFSTPIRMLFGNGLSTMYLDSTKFVEHNTFVQSLSNIGVVGTITLLACYISSFRGLLSPKCRKGAFLYMPLCATLFCNAFINSLYSLQFDFSIFMSFLIMSIYCQKAEINNHFET